MLISVDGEEYPELQECCCTLGELLEQVKGKLDKSGQMIIGIECDGQKVAPDAVESAMAQQADTYWQIDFTTATPADLADQALRATGDMLDQIGPLADKIAEMLNQSLVKDAMDSLGQLFRFWNDCHQGVANTLKLMRIDPGNIKLGDDTAADIEGRLTEQLRDVKAALENKDYVQLADILSYELAPLTKQWQELVNVLLQKCGSDSN